MTVYVWISVVRAGCLPQVKNLHFATSFDYKPCDRPSPNYAHLFYAYPSLVNFKRTASGSQWIFTYLSSPLKKSGTLQFVYVYISSPEQDLNPRLACYYRYAPHNDVSVNDGPHIRRWSHKIIIYYNIIM